ncbi:response regulator transcription factor [Cryptosporangium phraense]|uniref:Response regulator transcription factor n=1 Tax=Cryptosporangium phraense TaxID=2593070 RepID=A0A545AZ07_9ACTN|nr:response regulator transcription factor [Cryptosporangium phraense]TQS46570.1 response regulator transcription factor [Cryptosporangium phraense]
MNDRAGQRRVLVVDDEENVSHLVSTALRLDGFTTVVADTAPGALAAVAEHDPDLVVLDIMLGDAGGMDGVGVLRRLREAGAEVPVIFLTARDASGDVVAGLRAGADDYVVKPFRVEELLARVHAVMRRAVPDPARAATLQVADLELDEESREVHRAGQEVHLTATEFELLRYLMRNERVVVSKAQILERVWRYDFGGQSNIVELYIGYLRKKIDNVEPRLIHTVRGAGYVLKAPR